MLKRMEMLKLDPNWKFAKEHGEASRPGIQNSTTNVSRRNSILMCPCCLNVIHKEPVSLWESPKELSFLGFGFPLFYNMIQYCLISLFLLILSESAILLYLSVNETCPNNNSHRLLASQIHDSQYPCQSPFVILARVNQDIHDRQPFDRIIRSLSFIAQFLLMIYFRDVQRKLASYHIQRTTRIKDFSVFFRNLPKVPGIQRTLKQFLTKLDPQLKVHEIFLMPKIDYFHQLQLQKLQIIEHMKRIIKEQKFSHSMKLSLQTQLQRVNLELLQTCKKIQMQYKQDELFSTKAIVILQTKQQKSRALKLFKKIKYQQLQKYFRWMAEQVTLDSAPEPRQIIWANINYPKYKRWLRVLLGWVLSALFLAIVTLIFYFLLIVKSESHSITILIIILLLIQFFNKFIMKIFLHWFSDLEMPETSSDRQFSYAFKYTLGMFFTTAIMSLLVEVIVYNNVIHQYGIVQNETIMFFFNAFMVNLIWIINPQYYIHKIKRWYYFGVKNITQKEANNLMEDYPYDMGKRYAEVLQTMWFAFLYASLIPIGTFLSFIGFCIYYWVDKYNLLRRSKIQNSIQSQLPIKAVKLLELTLLWKPLGELLFDLKIRGDYHFETLVMIGVSLFSLILPWNSILDYFFHQNFNVSKQTYNDVKYRFTETYQTVDPIQRMLAIQKFIKEQNNSRLKKHEFNEKQSHTILQIREYNDDNVSDKRSDNRYSQKKKTKQTDQIDMSSFQITLKPGKNTSEKYFENQN